LFNLLLLILQWNYFSALAIAEASGLEQDSLSGSVLSLARSNSTNSFHDGNL